MIRTRFAPSPTGYLHIGGARTALYAWAFARKHGGKFILRVEDTDQERSSSESVDAILDSMTWLGLDWDEGPFFQMQRLRSYEQAAAVLLDSGNAYWCYATPEELSDMRDAQRRAGEKPRYDGRWRPERRSGNRPPEGVPKVLRFRNPDEGSVGWSDLVKGEISFSNNELDDFVLLRSDGTPTYNFGVVVDDHEMELTHVIRGDDHVNNTPRQINLYRALNYSLPQFAHVPMILGSDGERLSKRHGAVSVMQYYEEGFLPGAVINYLARLGWSHGDEEIFTPAQFIDWFDLGNISRSPAKFDSTKFTWVNGEHINGTGGRELASQIKEDLLARNVDFDIGPNLIDLILLLRDRANSLKELIETTILYYREPEINPGDADKFLTEISKPAVAKFVVRLEEIEWSRENISTSIKETLKEFDLKMPQLAMPLRLLLIGTTQTPAIDALIHLFGCDLTVMRLRKAMSRVEYDVG